MSLFMKTRKISEYSDQIPLTCDLNARKQTKKRGMLSVRLASIKRSDTIGIVLPVIPIDPLGWEVGPCILSQPNPLL